ncbi:MAG: hypothetical protein J5I98_14990 [Phaeodactylibacter sp.]|nr:hypothetical protein [Phaeodactylibacter sp.]
MRALFLTCITTILAFGCFLSRPSTGAQKEECQTYFEFVKENWINDGSYIFGFKGNPKYWSENQNTYFSWKCLEGLPKEQLLELFGEPTRTAKMPHFKVNSVTYCTQDKCRDSKDIMSLPYGGVIFEFDSNDNVNSIWVEPPLK